MDCGPETIGKLAAQLDCFGPVEGEPEWLVSAVWLCAGDADYLASSSTKVLSDGYIARPLSIHRVDDFVRQLRSELPDVAARLVGRTSDAQLPGPARPRPPADLRRCRDGPSSTDVLIRVAERASTVHRVACGLVFGFDAHRLLVGTDVGTLAMVLSEDPALIDRYLSTCEALSAVDYLSRCGD